MKIRVLTPESVLYDGEVESVLLPGEFGEFHILNNHAPVISTLKEGNIKLVYPDASKMSANFVEDTSRKQIGRAHV